MFIINQATLQKKVTQMYFYLPTRIMEAINFTKDIQVKIKSISYILLLDFKLGL
jgi:hypothetical protein